MICIKKLKNIKLKKLLKISLNQKASLLIKIQILIKIKSKFKFKIKFKVKVKVKVKIIILQLFKSKIKLTDFNNIKHRQFKFITNKF